MHHGKETAISCSCQAKIYAKMKATSQNEDQKKLIVIKMHTIHKGHHRYSIEELRQLIKLKDLPEDLKTSANELFLRGWNFSEICPILTTKHPSYK